MRKSEPRRPSGRPGFIRCTRKPLWELACRVAASLRWRPDSRPVSPRCTQSNCGSEPAREGGLIADLFLSGVHIHSCGNGRLWFRPYGHPFFKRQKGTKRLRPKRPAPRLGSAFLRSGIHLGASPPVGFASTSSRCVRLRRTALRAYPPDERLHSASRYRAGRSTSKARSRSKAAGELTLGLLSGGVVSAAGCRTRL